MEHRVGTVEEIRAARCRVVQVNGKPIGVIAVGEHFRAIYDKCPHMAASMTAGSVNGTFMPAGAHELVYGKHNDVIRCPWHGWEFDMRNGQSWFDPKRVKVRSYPVAVESGEELQKGPYVAETFQVHVEDSYVIIET